MFSCTTVMGGLENLLVQENTPVPQIQAIEDSLSRVHVHIAELRSVNKGAGTYYLLSEILSAIFEAGIMETPETREKELLLEKQTTHLELLVSLVSSRW